MILSLIPLPARLAVAAGSIAALVAGVVAWGSHKDGVGYARGAGEVTARWQAEDVKRAELAAAETAKRRADDDRTARIIQEAQDAASQAQARQRADKVVSDAASGALERRFRERLRELAAGAPAAAGGAGSQNPAVAPGGATSEDVAGVLADVYGRCLAQRQRYAEIADDARRAGFLCEAAHDALTVRL